LVKFWLFFSFSGLKKHNNLKIPIFSNLRQKFQNLKPNAFFVMPKQTHKPNFKWTSRKMKDQSTSEIPKVTGAPATKGQTFRKSQFPSRPPNRSGTPHHEWADRPQTQPSASHIPAAGPKKIWGPILSPFLGPKNAKIAKRQQLYLENHPEPLDEAKTSKLSEPRAKTPQKLLKRAFTPPPPVP